MPLVNLRTLGVDVYAVYDATVSWEREFLYYVAVSLGLAGVAQTYFSATESSNEHADVFASFSRFWACIIDTVASNKA